MSLNYNALTGFLIGLITIAVYIHVTYKQFNEVLRPKNWLTRLRWLLLMTLLVAIIGFVPSLMYQLYRTLGIEGTLLRNIATVSGNVSRLGGALLLEFVYNYRKKE